MLLPLLALMAGCAGGTTNEEHARYVQCDTVRIFSGSVAQSRFPGRVKAASEAGVAFRVALW